MMQLNAYLDTFWDLVTRENRVDTGTLIGVPRPYFIPAADPSNSIFQEMYYWDSYFIALGVIDTRHEQRVIDMAENMAYLIERFGFVPNGTRYYFTSRSQPPFFTHLVRLAHAIVKKNAPHNETAFLKRMLAAAIRKHDGFWMNEILPPKYRRIVEIGDLGVKHPISLNRYTDVNALHIMASCKSGWDHSARCGGDIAGSEAGHWLDYVPICVNSILYVVEKNIAEMAAILGGIALSEDWREIAQARAQTMQDFFWHEDHGFFYASLAGFYPLWAGWATQAQANDIVKRWLPQFLAEGGLITSLLTCNNHQWATPNGWAPLQWLVTEGLDRYGYADEANDIRQSWCHICENGFKRDHTLLEKYNVIKPNTPPAHGVYGTVKGFGWTNGVYINFKKRLSVLNTTSGINSIYGKN
ncbi:MAG: trehalase family glycosidase [Chloroflexota bacterium]|jgi:alpha,alpha-trehalase